MFLQSKDNTGYLVVPIILFFFFFFQAEDGIRDVAVTGVQTCALPISVPAGRRLRRAARDRVPVGGRRAGRLAGAAARRRLPAGARRVAGAREPAGAEIGRASCRERV